MSFPAPRFMTRFAAVMCCGLMAIACDTSKSGLLTAPTAAGLPTSSLTIGDGPTVGTGESISQGQTRALGGRVLDRSGVATIQKQKFYREEESLGGSSD